MKKIFATVILLLIALTLFACGEVGFDDLVVTAADVADVPAGEYTLRYSISDYERFLSAHPGLELSVTVLDETSKTVEVRNNRVIDVEKGKTYTVVVTLTYVEGENVLTKRKQFTVTAVRIPPTVTFHVGTEVVATIPMEYGGSLDQATVDEIINKNYSDLTRYPDAGYADGYIWALVSQEWVVGRVDSSTAFTMAAVTEVKKDVHIYLKRTFQARGMKQYRIVFHNDGGTETATIEGDYLITISRPDLPEKAGYVFGGWYANAALTQRFNWNSSAHRSLTANYDLYAKWLTASLPTVESAFDYLRTDPRGYQLVDNDGYPYCLVKAKDGENYAGETVLPVGCGNIPVRGFVDGAFAGCEMTSVVIPANYCFDNYHVFSGCASLTSVTFASGSEQTYLDEAVFKDCTALTSVTLPEKLSTIDVSAFENCSNLAEITFPSTLTVINARSFYGCALTAVEVPDSVHTVGERAFDSCADLATIAFSENSDLVTIHANSVEGTAVTAIRLPYYFYQNKLYPFAETDIIVTYYPKPEGE